MSEAWSDFKDRYARFSHEGLTQILGWLRNWFYGGRS